MRDRGILMAAAMVRATLADLKTQTRRAVNPQPPPECSIHYMLGNESWLPEEKREPLHHHWEAWGGPLFDNRPPKALAGGFSVNSPYGKPGDRLWVREAWRAPINFDHLRPRDIPRDTQVQYEAIGDGRDETGIEWGKYRHARFMPRWASRMDLEVTDVRVERLQTISEADCLAEGIEAMRCPDCHLAAFGLPGWGHDELNPTAQGAYRFLWETINGPGSWDANPFVWVVEFRRIPCADRAADQSETAKGSK